MATVGLWRRPNILVLFNFADGLRMCNCFFRVAKLAIFAEIAAVKSAKRLKGVLKKGEKERPEGVGGGSFRRFFILGALGALGLFALAEARGWDKNFSWVAGGSFRAAVGSFGLPGLLPLASFSASKLAGPGQRREARRPFRALGIFPLAAFSFRRG